MNSTEDFFNLYKIDEFYKQQKEWSKKPLTPFKRKVHKKLSFGKIPGYRNFDLFYERYQSAVTILQSKGLIKEGMKILDIGAGEGFFKIFFDADFKDKLNWDGLEFWKERAAFCRHLGYNIEEVDLEKGKIPYQENTYDIVIASHVLEHLPNPQNIVKELSRVLKKNGIMIIATPTKPPILAALDRFYHKIKKSEFGETQQAFTHNSLQKMVLNALDLTKTNVIDKRGFRIFSSRKKLPLEDWKWFYDFSVYLGKKILNLVPEVNLIIKNSK